MIITLESCKDLNDNEIVVRSLGNIDYFSCLFQRYEPEMLRYINRISGVDMQEAQDILQDSFIKIWRNLYDFDHGMKFSSWIYRIVHNETVSFIRKTKSYGKNRKTDMKEYEDSIPDDPVSVTDEEIIYTQKIMSEMPLKYREVLVLKFFENKSYEEISDILRIPEGTVAIRINRAKQKFKEIAGIEKNLI